MSDLQFTRCPGCATVYRVTGAQLALREGQVRCGHCRAVFDATAHRVDLAPRPPPSEGSASRDFDDELARGRATVTLREASALEAPGREDEQAAEGARPADVQPIAKLPPETEVSRETEVPPETEVSAAPAAQVLRDDRPPPTSAEEASADAPVDIAELEAARAALRPRRRTRTGRVFYAIVLAILLAGLVAQSTAFFRDDIVAHVPQAAGALDALCRTLACRTGPRRDVSALSIEGSDLQADPAHRGLLVLTATLRNRDARPVAWPDLELTLTDSSDQAVVRRVLKPDDYLAASARPPGLAAHSEHQIRLFLDASATRQAGYRLYLFYP